MRPIERRTRGRSSSDNAHLSPIKVLAMRLARAYGAKLSEIAGAAETSANTAHTRTSHIARLLDTAPAAEWEQVRKRVVRDATLKDLGFELHPVLGWRAEADAVYMAMVEALDSEPSVRGLALLTQKLAVEERAAAADVPICRQDPAIQTQDNAA